MRLKPVDPDGSDEFRAPFPQVAQRRVLTDSALPAWIGSVLTVFPKPFAIRVIRMLRSSMAI